MVVSFMCLLIALVILLGFYGHDRAVMKSTANTLATKAGLWGSRYVSPLIDEVDYEALKAGLQTDLSIVEELGYECLEQRLLLGRVNSVQILKGYLKKHIQVNISVDFKIWNYAFTQEIQSDAVWIDSRDLPRRYKETGE